MSSSRSSLPDSFGMPDSYVSQGGSTSGGPGVPIESAKELYEKRKHFQKAANLKDDVSEYHVEVWYNVLQKSTLCANFAKLLF